MPRTHRVYRRIALYPLLFLQKFVRGSTDNHTCRYIRLQLRHVQNSCGGGTKDFGLAGCHTRIALHVIVEDFQPIFRHFHIRIEQHVIFAFDFLQSAVVTCKTVILVQNTSVLMVG